MADPDAPMSRNDVVLRGRLAAPMVERSLPSGDAVGTFRLVVDRVPRRGSSARVDTLDCVAFTAALRRSLSRWNAGDVIEVSGALHRRVVRAGAGAASRYEVEISRASRVQRAPA